METIQTEAEARAALEELRRQGWTRDATCDELVRRGLTRDQATCVVEGYPFPPRRATEVAGPEALAAEEEVAVAGIRGWLLVWAFGLLLDLWLLGRATWEDVKVLRMPGLPDVEALRPGFRGALALELAVNAGLLLMTAVAAWLFFRRKRQAPRVLVVLLALQALLAPATILYSASVLREPVAVAAVASAVVAAVVWIPYFLRSRRVSLTFVQ
jgi:hypothetical protein